MEFFCPYCRMWITDVVHVQHHHKEGEYGEPDPIRDFRVRVGGVIYDTEDDCHEREGETDEQRAATRLVEVLLDVRRGILQTEQIFAKTAEWEIERLRAKRDTTGDTP